MVRLGGERRAVDVGTSSIRIDLRMILRVGHGTNRVFLRSMRPDADCHAEQGLDGHSLIMRGGWGMPNIHPPIDSDRNVSYTRHTPKKD